MSTDAEKLGRCLVDFAKAPSFFKGSGKSGGFGKSSNILSQHRMWSEISKVRPSLSWSKPEATEAMGVVLKECKENWKEFNKDDETDWLSKMPNRFKFVCRAINQARLKKTSKWVHKLGLAAASKEGAAAQAAVKEPDSDKQQGVDGAVGASEGAGAPASSADGQHYAQKDSLKHEGKYVLGFCREHMKAWRCMPGQKKEFTKDVKKPEGSTPEDPTLATWSDGFKARIFQLSCAEFDAIEDTEKVSTSRGTYVWETRPTENSRIWVSRPTSKNNVFCVHSKVDGSQSQMCQVKATAFGDDEEQIKEAEKLAVKLAQKLASTEDTTKDMLKELRDKALPTPTKVKRLASQTDGKQPAPKKAKSKAKAIPPCQAEAAQPVVPAEPVTPTPDEGKITDLPGSASANESESEKAAISHKCGFCGEEPTCLDIFKKYNLCTACYNDNIFG
ncbi:unnamed protein product [Prorocentrum cordatum]|uniref:Uncharacterized protein n=1 Tax=Prorocentrum cordatum TaxID=2364126 RepID=A0ABN9SVT9_9DINO|nr:unnamed protein product [Polarella glacialis]